MCRFEITREDDRLVLTMPLADRMMAVGCILLVCSLACAAVIGLLAFVWEADSGSEHSGLQPAQLFSPHGNHFGFLWLVAMIVLFAIVPIYATRAYRAAITIVFDRTSGHVLRNGRMIARIPRIERVRVRRTCDPDDVPLYKLLLIHGDGLELALHASYDDQEIGGLAREIADFIAPGPMIHRPSSIVD